MVDNFRTIERALLSPKDLIRHSIHEQRPLVEPLLIGCFSIALLGGSMFLVIFDLAISHIVGQAPFLRAIQAHSLPFMYSLVSVGSGIGIMILGLLIAAVAHLTAMFLGGQGSYSDSVRTTFYSMAPYALVALPLLFVLEIPFLALFIAFGMLAFAQLWNFWILTESFKEAYGVTGIRVLGVIMIPMIVIFMLVVSLLTIISLL